jgi:hypothetical protein
MSLSVVVGLALPTGATRISGRGYSPYLQFPWSQEIADGWSANGMLTTFWFPDQPASPAIEEVTLSFERKMSFRSDAFIEYIGDYRMLGVPTQTLNSGYAYRITKNQQLDIHIGAG